jgi:hypothetical protein
MHLSLCHGPGSLDINVRLPQPANGRCAAIISAPLVPGIGRSETVAGHVSLHDPSLPLTCVRFGACIGSGLSLDNSIGVYVRDYVSQSKHLRRLSIRDLDPKRFLDVTDKKIGVKAILSAKA